MLKKDFKTILRIIKNNKKTRNPNFREDMDTFSMIIYGLANIAYHLGQLNSFKTIIQD